MGKEREMNVRSGEKVRCGGKTGVVIKPTGAGHVLIRWSDGKTESVHAFELELIGRHD